MSRNGSGTQTSPAGSFPAVANTLIESTKFNNVINDINSSITQSISNDGQTPIVANIPMNGFKFTGLAAGANSGDSVEYAQMNTAISTAIAASPAFPSGTKLPFYQATPPSGWTAATVQDDSMMRVVTSGTTGGSSGNPSGDSPILNNVVPSHQHTYSGTTSGQSADHTHTPYGQQVAGGGTIPLLAAGGAIVAATQATAGTSNDHTHTYSGTVVANTGAANWQPRYMDFCIGQKT